MDSRITITSGGLQFPLQAAPIVRDMAGMSALAEQRRRRGVAEHRGYICANRAGPRSTHSDRPELSVTLRGLTPAARQSPPGAAVVVVAVGHRVPSITVAS